MAESLESRKFERKPQFDVPIPVMAKNRSHTPKQEEGPKRVPETGPGTMAFSLLTKKGKGQQVSRQYKRALLAFTLGHRINSTCLGRPEQLNFRQTRASP